eukprot:snap_masked-scaffold_8-processed-gene-13.16-mRNA-1 protein AED:1.00 eAED:1.00 QI:0/0/0/0/1/1/2/0/271
MNDKKYNNKLPFLNQINNPQSYVQPPPFVESSKTQTQNSKYIYTQQNDASQLNQRSENSPTTKKFEMSLNKIYRSFRTVRQPKEAKELMSLETSVNKEEAEKTKKKKNKTCCCFSKVPDFQADTENIEVGSASLNSIDFSIPINFASENYLDIRLEEADAVIVLEGGLEAQGFLREPVNIAAQDTSVAVLDINIDFDQDETGVTTLAFTRSCLLGTPFQAEVLVDLSVEYLGFEVDIEGINGGTFEMDCPVELSEIFGNTVVAGVENERGM